MKKTKLILSTMFLLITSTIFSQTNKPNVGEFGIRVGVNIPNFGLGFTFSRLLKKNIECGSSIGFSISSTKSSQTTYGIKMSSTSGNMIDVKQDFYSRFLSYTINIAPFLAYHIPIKNNLDVFAGGRLLFSLGEQTNYKNINRLYADNYESKGVAQFDMPIYFGIGAGALIGADYYFRKNMAVGVSGYLGFISTINYGTQTEKTTTTNSGSLNPTQGVKYHEQKWSRRDFYTNTGANGNVGINFTFFFTRKISKNQSPEPK